MGQGCVSPLVLAACLSSEPPSEELPCCSFTPSETRTVAERGCAFSGNDLTCKSMLFLSYTRIWPVSEGSLLAIEGRYVGFKIGVVWSGVVSLNVNEEWVPATEVTYLFQMYLFYLEEVGYVWILIVLKWWMKRKFLQWRGLVWSSNLCICADINWIIGTKLCLTVNCIIFLVVKKSACSW